MWQSIKKWYRENYHQCSRCEARDSTHGHKWIRGWNSWCNQVYGDWGWYCNKCGKIDWEVSLEKHKESLPSWCEPYKEK